MKNPEARDWKELGKKQIQRYEILFSINSLIREDFEEILSQAGIKQEMILDTYIADVEWKEIVNRIKKLPNVIEEIDLGLLKHYYKLRKPDDWLGDLYFKLYEIKSWMHWFIKTTLQKKYGTEDSGWWQKIPSKIRSECVCLRQEDENPEDKYSYTTLIHLMKIIDKNWGFFSGLLPKSLKDKKQFCDKMERLNKIRNKVMHPVKQFPTIDDFSFVIDFFDDEFSGVIGLIVQKLKEGYFNN